MNWPELLQDVDLLTVVHLTEQTTSIVWSQGNSIDGSGFIESALSNCRSITLLHPSGIKFLHPALRFLATWMQQ